MAGRIITCGGLAERYETERLLSESHPELHVETVEHPWELVEKAGSGAFDVALFLKGPITKHQERLQAITSLRTNGFAGRILYVGAFLTEKQDAVTAGADYAFDSDLQRSEEVTYRALYRPVLAADHPYLRYLLVGDWVEVESYGATLPERAPAVLLAATSCHEDAGFWASLASFVRSHPQTACIVVDDDGGAAAQSEALASGVQPYVMLAEEGLCQLQKLIRRYLREAWLARLTAV